MKIIGELIYLSINTRPDVSYVVNMLAQYNVSPEAHHYVAAKRVLRYLSGTIDLQLHYGGDHANGSLRAYTDASWANAVGQCSISGYVWFYAGSLISHVSKKQATIALSSTEAEYMATTHVIQEGLWLESLFSELRVSLPTPIKIHLDNTGMIALSTAAKFHNRLKHIDLHYHFIRYHVNKKTFVLQWIPSHKNVADVLMKPLPRPSFSRFLLALGLMAC